MSKQKEEDDYKELMDKVLALHGFSLDSGGGFSYELKVRGSQNEVAGTLAKMTMTMDGLYQIMLTLRASLTRDEDALSHPIGVEEKIFKMLHSTTLRHLERVADNVTISKVERRRK